MAKTKTYRYGKWNFKAYQKTVGQGYEVGLYFNNKPIFVGNFIRANEAAKWWNQLNREVRGFTKRYWATRTTSAQWYGKFFSNHLYRTYYTFLDRLFTKYNTTYNRAFNTNVKKYFKYRKNWTAAERFKQRAG